MKASILSFSLVVLFFGASSAQTTPVDFNRKDCNGVQRHLFGDLDSGKAVILEFFMINCAPCPAAGTKLEAMKANLLTQYPGKIRTYAIAYNNTYTQAQVKNWVSSNGFAMIPMDSGATQVAYYGGMGMPTIVIAGGVNTHSILGSPYIGFNTNDTTQMAADIRALLGAPSNTSTVGLHEISGVITKFEVFPVPASDKINISVASGTSAHFEIDLLDINGRSIKTYPPAKGNAIVSSLSVEDVAAGNYILQVRSGEAIATRKITIIH